MIGYCQAWILMSCDFPGQNCQMLPFEKLISIAVQEGAKRTVRNLKNLIESS